MSQSNIEYDRKLRIRHTISAVFEWVCFFCTWIGIFVLVVLLCAVVYKAWGWLDWQFLTSKNSTFPQKAGVMTSLWGTFWLMLFSSMFSIPVGVGAAIYLEEFAKDHWTTRFIRLNIANLAGIPSIVYGLLGLTVFVHFFHLFEGQPFHRVIYLGPYMLNIRLPFDRSVISGALTLGLMILPVIIIASQEALRAVPQSIRHAAYALGATKWQTIWYQVLPASLPGIMTGVILAVSRAIGETAPLIVVGSASFLMVPPGNISNITDVIYKFQGVLDIPYASYTALPYDIYNWVKRPQSDFEHVAAAGILVLIVMLLVLNGLAIFIRSRFEKNLRW